MQLRNFRHKFNSAFSAFLFVFLFLVCAAFAAFAAGGQNNRTDAFAILSSNAARYLFADRDGDNGSNSFSVDSASAAEIGQSRQSADKERRRGAEVFEQFQTWVKSYGGKTLQADSEEAATGEALAKQRQQLLKQLIETDPQAALGKALPEATLAMLPEQISQYTERYVSARGDYLVYVLDGIGTGEGKRTSRADGSRTERTVVIGEDRYRAYVYGRRETMTTKMDIPLQGIVVGGAMAVDEAPAVRVIEKGTGKAEVGGERMDLASGEQVERFVAEQIEWESTIGPRREQTAKSGEADGGSRANSIESAEAVTNTWTEGAKTVLVMRVQFPDRKGDPVGYDDQLLTKDRAQNLYSQVSDFYKNNSYNKIPVQTTVVTVLLDMPRQLSEYIQEGNPDAIITDARKAALSRGYDSNNYSFDVVAFSDTQSLPWRGLSLIGSKGSLLNGAFSLTDASHELGHNYGLMHANLWKTTDGSIIGEGANLEYGDCFDIMAAYTDQTNCQALGPNSHFNAKYKRLLDWLTDTNVQTITTSGDYPIYAQDVSTNSGIRALKIRKNSTQNYWIEFRQGMNGALIRWDYASRDYRETQLLDMHPETSTTDDALLAIGGKPFYDPENGMTVTVERNNTFPESLKVKVQFDVAPPPCAYTMSPTSMTLPAVGGTYSVNVTPTARPDCNNWTAISNDPSWLTVIDGASGTGNGTVRFSAIYNPGSARIGSLTIGTQTFSITQTSAQCTYSVSLTNPNISANGGILNFVQTKNDPGCYDLTPVYTGTSTWISINNGAAAVSANTGSARSGTVRLTAQDFNGGISEATLTVYQDGVGEGGCTFSFNQPVQSFSSAGGIGNLSVTTNAGCAYTVVSNVPWIMFTSNASGNGNGTFNFLIGSNSSAARTGTVTLGNQTFTINQAAGTSKSRKRSRFF